MLLPAVEGLKEQARGVLFEGEVADLVDDDHALAEQPCEFAGHLAGAVGVEPPRLPSVEGRRVDHDGLAPWFEQFELPLSIQAGGTPPRELDSSGQNRFLP